jgi:hypothetical protein
LYTLHKVVRETRKKAAFNEKAYSDKTIPGAVDASLVKHNVCSVPKELLMLHTLITGAQALSTILQLHVLKLVVSRLSARCKSTNHYYRRR